jgi:hypothetical protein
MVWIYFAIGIAMLYGCPSAADGYLVFTTRCAILRFCIYLITDLSDCLASPGTKFFVVCETGAPNMEILLKTIYELYTEFVLKNPFYEMEMPIRCELFDLNLAQVIQKDRAALLGR